jgi:NAD(P)-dependent dehydrogenase (short-subunit alcohol dehydrogenase family)
MNRLHLFGLDLRMLPRVEEFCRGLVSRFSRLDVFVANAAQTVRRPPAYYRELAAIETETMPDEPTSLALPGSAAPWFSALSLVPLLPDDHTADAHIPAGWYDSDGEPLDLRPANSWGLPQEHVSTVELIEVQAVNVMSPFVMLRELRPLFRREPGNKFAVVVSASEGRFAAEKSGQHPHTNMAKAAVNMLVRTSAEEFAADRVYLSAVDPGWFSVQSAAPSAERMHAAGGRLPLDAEDAAARILDPVFAHLHADTPPHGVLFKDYRQADW